MNTKKQGKVPEASQIITCVDCKGEYEVNQDDLYGAVYRHGEGGQYRMTCPFCDNLIVFSPNEELATAYMIRERIQRRRGSSGGFLD